METNANIEERINRAIQSVKNMQSVELPHNFSEKVLNKIHTQNNVRSLYSFPPLLKAAAIFAIIIMNILTLRLALSPQPTQSQTQYVTIKDFVNGYQINDINEELLTSNNTPTHEQP